MNAPISDTELCSLQEWLEARLVSLHAEIDREREIDEQGRISQYAGDVHDRGEESNVEAAADVSAAVIGRHQAELAAIRDALARIEEGTYGTCVACGSAIGGERLRAYPSAKRCIACQSTAERSRG